MTILKDAMQAMWKQEKQAIQIRLWGVFNPSFIEQILNN
jgi:hypothetical protein